MQFINIMSVDECLKYIAGKHMKPTQYYNFSEKGKNHWFTTSQGKTIIYWPADSGNNIANATDNTLIDNNYFKITRYGYNPWRSEENSLFYTRRLYDNGYDGNSYRGTSYSKTPLYQDNHNNRCGYIFSRNGTASNTIIAAKFKTDAATDYRTTGLSYFGPVIRYNESA